MEVQLLRTADGRVLAMSGVLAEDGIPVEPEPEEGMELEQMDLKRRELWDLDGLYKRVSRGGK